MASGMIGIVAICFVSLASGYYFPLAHRPITLCHPPDDKGCIYKPNLVVWHVGQKITFYNPHGYEVIGYSTCQKDGTWDHYPPECPPKCCLDKLEGKVTLYEPYQYGHKKCWDVGAKIHFKCPYGYYLKGEEYAKCLYGGHWSNKAPICIKKVVCYLPKLKDHCDYGPYNKKYWNKGEKITFHCEKGYDLKGSDYALCKDDGKWDHDTPYCHKRVMCHAPALTPYCDYQPKHKITWYPGEKVTFHCPYGYKLVGYPYATCTYYGKWSNHAPVCKKKAPPVKYGYGPFW